MIKNGLVFLMYSSVSEFGKGILYLILLLLLKPPSAKGDAGLGIVLVQSVKSETFQIRLRR